MKTIRIKTCPGFSEWRDAARNCLLANLPPDKVLWLDKVLDNQNDLFASMDAPQEVKSNERISIPKSFIEKASVAICYKSDNRFDFLYRVLWRLVHEDKHLLLKITDDDVIRLGRMIKAVHRDAYKIKAFLRFREINDSDNDSLFIAWYEPEHYSLELPLQFFKTRFANMKWAILTPYKAAYWDKESLRFHDNPDPSLYPQDDKFENYWCTYYASIFNPARVKKQAMLNQMPKKYWKNMPETKLIEDLLQGSHKRVTSMLEMQEKD